MAVRRIVSEWDGLAKKFGALRERFLAHESLTNQTKGEVVRQFVECNLHMNELGNKSRLLASRIGKDERPDQAETLAWESVNLLQHGVDQGKEEVKVAREEPEKILSSSKKEEFDLMGRNLEKLAKASKKSMLTINLRLIPLEAKVDTLTKEDWDAACEFDPMSSGGGKGRPFVDGFLNSSELSNAQDRVKALEVLIAQGTDGFSQEEGG